MNPRYLPKVGDRVRISADGPVFIVIEVNAEADTVSVMPEEGILTVSLDQISVSQPERPMRAPLPFKRP